MSGLASFPPTCVGLPTYRSRLARVGGLRPPVPSVCQTGQPSFGEGKWQVSQDYGDWPQWRIDREIVFNTAPSGTPSRVASRSGLPFPPSTGVSTTPQSTLDGQRTSIMLNWPALLKQ